MWDIKPFSKVGPVHFGQSRDEVRSILDSGYRVFQKAEGENETDAYNLLGIHIYYDADDRVEFIEAFSPAQLQFEGIPIIGRNVGDFAAEIRSRGYESQCDEIGANYDELGFGITVNGEEIEGVAVFREGYYG